MGKGTRRKRRGVPNSVICYLMLKAKSVVSKRESDWDDFFRGKYSEFWTNPPKISVPLRNAPSDGEIQGFSVDSELRQRRSLPISRHEFAKMVSILVENEESRSALLHSGIYLTHIWNSIGDWFAMSFENQCLLSYSTTRVQSRKQAVAVYWMLMVNLLTFTQTFLCLEGKVF